MMGLVRTCHVGRIGESSCACGSHFHEYLRSRGCKHSGGHRHCSSQVLRSISSKVATARCQPSIRWLSAMALMVAEKLKMSGSNLSRMQYSSRCTRFKPSGKTAVQIHLNLLDDILDDYRYMKVNRLKVRLKTLTCLHKVGWTSAFCLASFFCSLLLSESTQSTHMSPSTFTVLPWYGCIHHIHSSNYPTIPPGESNKIDPKGCDFCLPNFHKPLHWLVFAFIYCIYLPICSKNG